MAHLDGNGSPTPSPPSIPQIINTAKSTARSSLSPLRHRTLGRASTFSDALDASKLRRTSSLSSTFSDSIDDARHSIKSTTDDILLPRATSPDLMTGHEPSHWHSIPLALALLPAAGGLFFEKGSVVITDITLLALAAIFLNWSVRLPWDWYHSAQAINIQEDYPTGNGHGPDTILEEDDNEESQTSRTASPAPSRLNAKSSDRPDGYDHNSTSSASSELRIYELLALLTCFICPIVGAWLLHHIRAQLSRPSEGLVSNYNLTIFLLASELRPLSHLIKLVQARTLHLQRTVSTHPFAPPPGTPSLTPTTIHDITSRIADLETHIADTVPTAPNTPSKFMQSQLPDVTTQVRKTLQPDLDALNRAVRRYEKRATLLSLQTEKRLHELEARMGDAITLAAAAERSSQLNKQRRNGSGNVILVAVDWLTQIALLPVHLMWSLLVLPGQVLSSFVGVMDDKFRGRRNVSGGSSSSSSSSGGARKDTRIGNGNGNGNSNSKGGHSEGGRLSLGPGPPAADRKRSYLGMGSMRSGKKAM